MPNVLEVQIVGDVSSLEKSLKQAESLQAEYTKSIEKTSSELKDSITVTRGYAKAIDDLNKEYKDGAISSKDYSKQLANLKRDEKESAVATADLRKELANLKKEQKEVGGSFDTASKKVANGGNALMQFSRIAQDAPFGIQGIGNNITATVEAFGHLQKSTGSTGAALKAVAGSMLGSGGILLAVSLVTTGLTYMAQNGLTVSDVFEKLNGTFDENAKALSDINKEAAKTSGEEIANVKALAATASDASLPYEKRLLAVKKLQDEFPAYFGNLTKEQILNGNVAGAVDEVSKALIARARASAIAGKLGENAAKRLDLEEKREQAILDISKQQQYVRKQIAKANAGERDLGVSTEEFSRINLQAVVKQYNDVKKEIAELDAQTVKLAGTQAQATKDSVGLLETQTEAEKALAAAKALAEAKAKSDKEDKKDTKNLEAAQKELDKLKEISFQMQEATSVPLFEVDEKTTANLDKLAQIAFQIQEITSAPLFNTDKTEENLDKLKDIASEMAFTVSSKFDIAKEAANAFANGTTSAVNALGSQLASSLETGNAALDAFTGSVIQSLADIAAAQLAGLIAKQAVATTSLGVDAAVSTGNAVTAATETAAASGPAAAFVLPALVGAAIGFIAAAFSGIKFAHGGIVPGGSYTGDKIPAMLNSGEAVLNSQQQANTLMAVANGNANSLQGNRQSSNFTLETKLRGSDLLLGIKREERKR